MSELEMNTQTSSLRAVKLGCNLSKCVFYADDLVILSPTKEGLQQSLDLLHQYCRTWTRQLP